MDNYGTHQKVLFKAVSFTQKNVIEFGAGDFSTEQLHELCRDRLLVTVEDNEPIVTGKQIGRAHV